MISCWVAENNGWKYACHNTVPEQSCLIHICLGSQASSFLTAETVQWLICWQEKTFQHQMMWEEPRRLDATSVARPRRVDAHICRGLSSPLLPQGHHTRRATSWSPAVTCVALRRGGGERRFVPQVFLGAQVQLEESVSLCESCFQCSGLYGFYGCVIA